MTDKVKATLSETGAEAVKPIASEQPKGTQTTVEGAGEVMTQAGPEAIRSKK